MRTNKLWLPAVLGMLAFVARADGPHWHVPNPDGEDESSVDGGDGKKGATPVNPPKGGKNPLGGVGGGGAKGAAADYMKNPGNFFNLDQPCIDYYERHCVVKFGGAGKEKEFYILIMNRCAQAMREVDSYLPCPDSFPLWHTEELRELMVEFAGRTWIRSTQLKPEYAKACAEFCVQCFVDTVRFKHQDKDKGGGIANLKAAFDGNRKIQELLAKMADEKDAGKKQALWAECTQALKNAGVKGSIASALVTFKMITGDIPLQVDEAESRMMLTLVNMGSIVLPFLQEATKNTNPEVQRAVWSTIDMIQRRFAKPTMLPASMSNCISCLRDIQAKPGSAEAAAAGKILKNMGSPALPYLVRIAESDTLDLKAAALAALQSITGKTLGTNVAKWKELVEGQAVAQAAKEEKAAQAAAVEEKKPAAPKAPGAPENE